MTEYKVTIYNEKNEIMATQYIAKTMYQRVLSWIKKFGHYDIIEQIEKENTNNG